MPSSGSRIASEVLAFHQESLVLDLHVDTLLWMRLLGYDIGKRHRNLLPTSPFGWHVDLPRAREGGLNAAVLGVMVNPPKVRKELPLSLKLLSGVERSRSMAQMQATFDQLDWTEAQHPDRFAFVRSGSQLRRAVSEGKLACLACLEGTHGLEGDLANLQLAYDRGLRMVGMVHFQATEMGYPMTVPAYHGKGLTPLGFDLISEMERLGMIVDLAHLNPAGVDDALSVMKKPCVVSHTACRAVHDSRRNLDDDQIRRVADAGGVIGIAFGRYFIGRAGLEGLISHIEHLIRVGGADCAALGSDYDGTIIPVAKMGDVTCLPLITQALLGRGHAPGVVKKLLGENALRAIESNTGK